MNSIAHLPCKSSDFQHMDDSTRMGIEILHWALPPVYLPCIFLSDVIARDRYPSSSPTIYLHTASNQLLLVGMVWLAYNFMIPDCQNSLLSTKSSPQSSPASTVHTVPACFHFISRLIMNSETILSLARVP